ncbi:restriction endonuclease subunit S [Streptomyces hawaiiensis]|uniref:Restriction endonuclease subunit S n=2 Tax=Streptomyces hawaiiensis TaxID=67305 RepID=A0A6G5RRI0_9ACTN|nr:restriction endonuclease subunit S [Streptomyces hawaiiensis]
MLDAARNTGERKPYLGNRAVQWGRIDVSAAGVVPMTRTDLHRYRLRHGDLLVCEGGEVGRAAIWQDQLDECYFQKSLHRLRPRGGKEGYDVRLMLAFLEHWAATGVFANYVTQTSIAHLPRDKFVDMPLPLLSPSEQEAIGRVLDDTDRLINALESLIAKKRLVKQGMLQQFFDRAGRAPTGENGVREERQLGDLLLRPPRYGINAAAVPLTSGTPTYIRITDIDDFGRFSAEVGVDHPQSVNYRLNQGELVFARTGASVGKSYLYDPRDGELVYAGFLINIAPDPNVLNPAFFALFAQTKGYWDWVARTSVRSGQPGINGREFAQLPIYAPKIEEQNVIASTVSDIDNEIAVLGLRLDKARLIRTGMMQELLTGRTRLPVQGEDDE